MLFRRVTGAALVTILAFVVPATVPTVDLSARQNPSLAPFVPTPQDVVNRMLELASVTSADVVYDLGCGDGR